MILVEIVGERYLWVDALCIVQDEPDELGTILKFMGKIDEDAAFTIIAADNANADWGPARDTATFSKH
jgi:hypothetical protein